MPNVNSHRATYFEVLRKLNRTLELDEAFEKVKDKPESINHWYDYIFSKVILENNKEELTTLINEFKEKFSDEGADVIATLENMISIDQGLIQFSPIYLLLVIIILKMKIMKKLQNFMN